MTRILRTILLLIVVFYVINQVRKPSRWIGRFFAWMMNITHSSLTDWGLMQAPVLWLLRSTPLTPQDNREAFSAAGYADVQVFENPAKGWICVSGKKPTSS